MHFSQIPKEVAEMAGISVGSSFNNKRKKESESSQGNKIQLKKKSTTKRSKTDRSNSLSIYPRNLNLVDEGEERDVEKINDPYTFVEPKNKQVCIPDTKEITIVDLDSDGNTFTEDIKTNIRFKNSKTTSDAIVQADLKPTLIDKQTQTEDSYETFVASLRETSIIGRRQNRNQPPLKWGQSMGIPRVKRNVRYPGLDSDYTPPRAPAC